MRGQMYIFSVLIAVFVAIYQFNITEIISSNGLIHTLAAFCITMTYFFLGASLKAAIIYALIFSVVKEIIDPVFSYLDIANDIIGIAFALSIIIIMRDKLYREVFSEHR